MNRKTSWVIVILLGIMAILMAKTGVDLWSLGTDVDGDGIGVYFLIFEINDSVPEASIPTYAIGFFAFCALTLFISGYICYRTLMLKTKE